MNNNRSRTLLTMLAAGMVAGCTPPIPPTSATPGPTREATPTATTTSSPTPPATATPLPAETPFLETDSSIQMVAVSPDAQHEADTFLIVLDGQKQRPYDDILGIAFDHQGNLHYVAKTGTSVYTLTPSAP